MQIGNDVQNKDHLKNCYGNQDLGAAVSQSVS